jgi:two-component system OmpR family response regulator
MAASDIPVYIIEDDPVYREMVSDFIRDRFKRIAIHRFASGEEALAAMSRKPVIVILDYFLNKQNPGAMNGLDVLVELAEKAPQAKIIILSAQDDINVSVNMMKYGAYDYIVKNEADVYRLQNIINHIVTLIDYDRRILLTRVAMGVVGFLLLVLLLYVALR